MHKNWLQHFISRLTVHTIIFTNFGQNVEHMYGKFRQKNSIYIFYESVNQ